MIIERLLTVNPYSRPGKGLALTLGVVIHWTAAPRQSAEMVREFFESRKDGKQGYGSAHYIIGQTGDVLRCIPENEVAYHCGSSQADPASGKIYTDLAREKLGKYASFPDKLSPNIVTIGIELCPTDYAGNFSTATLREAVELCRSICHRYGLKKDQIFTHNGIVGWKDCPRMWTIRPILFEDFKKEVFA